MYTNNLDQYDIIVSTNKYFISGEIVEDTLQVTYGVDHLFYDKKNDKELIQTTYLIEEFDNYE